MYVSIIPHLFYLLHSTIVFSDYKSNKCICKHDSLEFEHKVDI